MAADPDLVRQIQILTERLNALEKRLARVEGVEDSEKTDEEVLSSVVVSDEPIAAEPDLDTVAMVLEEPKGAEPEFASIGQEPAAEQIERPPTEIKDEKPQEVVEAAPRWRQMLPPHFKGSRSTDGGRTGPTFTARAAAEIESLIGGRWYAVGGAGLLIIGMVLAFKWAYDSGVFNLMPDWLKCLFGGAFGVVLLILGEIARRRINDRAAVGLNAAGLGVCYVSAFAAYGFFEIIGPGAAFALLAIVAAIGVFIAARAHLVSVAVVSLLGGYLTPLLLNQQDASALVLPSWLMLLLIVGLVLSGWKGGAFTVLRSLVWWGTILYGIGGATAQATAQPIVWIVFFGLAWLAVHIELIYSAIARGITGMHSAGDGLTKFLQARPLIASLSTTAWSVGIGAVIAHQSGVLPTWCIAGAGQVSTMCLAMVLAGHLSVLRDRPESDIERLGAVLAMEAGALLITTVALAFTDWLEVSAWLAMGVAAVVAGRWIGSRGLDVYGLVVLAIGTTRLIVYDSWAGGLASGGESVFGLYLTRWSVLIAFAGAAWLAVSWLLTRDAGRRWLAVSRWCTGIGITVAFMSMVHPQMAEPALAVVWLSHGMVCVLVGRRLECHGLTGFGIGSVLVATVGTLSVQWWLGDVTGSTLDVAGFALGRWILLPIYAGVVWFMTAFLLSRSSFDGWRVASRWHVGAGITFVFAALLHETMASWALPGLWLTHGLTCMFVGRRLRCRGLLVFGVGSLGLATVSLGLQEWWLVQTTGEPFMAFGLAWTWWMLLVLYGVSSWVIAAFEIQKGLTFVQRQRAQLDPGELASPLDIHMPVLAIVIAACLLYGGFVHEQASVGAISAMWLVLSVFLSLSRRIIGQFAPDDIAMAGFGAAVLAWIHAYVMPGWTDSTATLGLHPGLLLALFLAAGWAFQGWWLTRRADIESNDRRVLFCAAAAVSVLFAATSYEVVRIAEAVATENTARKAAVSIWWGLFALALITVGFVRRISPSRHVGLALLGISMIKVLLIDLAGVPQGWRVASFLGLGVMMLGVSVAYIRLSGIIDDEGDVEMDDEAPVA